MLNSTQLRVAKDYVTVHGYSAQVCRLHNTSSVSIDYSLNSGEAVTVAAGGYETINVTSSTSEVRLKRTDDENTAVDVILEWGQTAEEAYEQSLLAIDKACEKSLLAIDKATVRFSVGPGRDYATIDSAIAAIAAMGAAAVIDLDPSVEYTSAVEFLTVPICIYGNGAVITTSSGITVKASYRAYDLNVVGNVIYDGASTDRYFITGGSCVGNVTLTTGLLHYDGSSLLSGLVTINGGTFECISTTITSQISHTDGQLRMQNFNVNASKDTAMITSTATSATSAIALVNGRITNSGTGTALDISANTQEVAGANALVNVSLTTSAGTASAIGGTAVCQIANCNYTTAPTGTGWTKSNWNISS